MFVTYVSLRSTDDQIGEALLIGYVSLFKVMMSLYVVFYIYYKLNVSVND